MELEIMKNILNGIRHGAFTQIQFITEPPLKAEYRNQGYKVYKEVTMVTRFGIHYGNIKEVKERESQPKERKIKDDSPWKNVYWEDKKNKILCCPDKDSYYLYTFPTKMNRHATCKYFIEHNGEKKKAILNDCYDMIIKSYWTKKFTNMMMLNIDNVISIGGKTK